jgi:hypothetical protein
MIDWTGVDVFCREVARLEASHNNSKDAETTFL